jgi:hypothetical protein
MLHSVEIGAGQCGREFRPLTRLPSMLRGACESTRNGREAEAIADDRH